MPIPDQLCALCTNGQDWMLKMSPNNKSRSNRVHGANRALSTTRPWCGTAPMTSSIKVVCQLYPLHTVATGCTLCPSLLAVSDWTTRPSEWPWGFDSASTFAFLMCPCGLLVDARGTHNLTCRQSSARISRHHILSETVYCACINANIPATKQPVGLSRTDGKRPASH